MGTGEARELVVVERLPELAVVVIAASMAIVVFRAGPSKPTNQWFTFFLVLIAGNFLATFVRYGLEPQLLPTEIRLLDRIALQFLAFDPPVLLYFALLFPRRHPFLDRPWAAPLIFAPGLSLTAANLLVPAPFMTARFPGEPELYLYLLVELYVLCYYLGAFVLLVHNFRTEPSALIRGQMSLLVIGFGVAIVPRVGLAAFPALSSLSTELLGPPSNWSYPFHVAMSAGMRILPTFVALAAMYVYSQHGQDAPRKALARRAFLIMSALIGLIAVFWSLAPLSSSHVLPDSPNYQGSYIQLPPEMTNLVGGGLQFTVRWIVFATVVGFALLKYQVFDVPAQVGEVARFAAAAGAVLVLAILAVAALPLARQIDPALVLMLAVLLLLAPGAARWASRMASRRLAEVAPTGGAPARRLELYRAALDAALPPGKEELPAAAKAELRNLQRDLGLSDEQHVVLLDILRVERKGRDGPSRADGRLAGRYELTEVLGEGSFGKCWRARDLLLGRSVVVKEVPSRGEGHELLKEARAAGRLNHPNIVTVHDVLEGPAVSYLIMEYMEGGSLRKHLERSPLPTPVAIRLLDDILAGLEAAHARHIVHGDLKPENILLTIDGRAKLGDFGSAYSTDKSGTFLSLPSRAGPATLLYMAPEQVQGADASAATDLYGVAAIAYEIMTGRPYVEIRGKDDFQLREAIVRAPVAPPPGLPPAIAEWIATGLQKDPSRRWPSAAEARARLVARAVSGSVEG